MVTVAGVGLTPMNTVAGPDVVTLAAAALTTAVADAELGLADVDGLLINRSNVPGGGSALSLDLARTAGLSGLHVLKEIECRGATAAIMLVEAFTLVESGTAKTVVVVFADTPLRTGGSAGASFAQYVGSGHTRAIERASGLLGAVPAYALIASRYAAEYGLTPEDLASVALTARRWAADNDMAVARDPLTLVDYLDSPLVATPLRRLDCARPVNGAAALVVAADSPSRPHVRLVGHAAWHPVRRRTGPGESWFDADGVPAAELALRDAGITRDNVDVLQLYDPFTIVTLCLLEAYGFAPPGEAARWMHEGHGAPGGRLPLNTGGGHLSGWYLQGMTPLVEGVLQLRGAGGRRQVPDAQTAFVAAMGGRLDNHVALVLRREE